jgi:hypothetical protein
MRALALVLAFFLVLVAALVSQAVWDSAVGAWIAFGAVFVMLAARLLGRLPGMPDWWPFDGDGDA